MVAPCKLQVGPTCWGRLHSFPRVISKEVGVVRRRKHRAGEKLIYGNDREPAGEDSAVGALTPGARRGGVGGIMYGKVRSQTRMMPRGMPAASRVLSNIMARSGGQLVVMPGGTRRYRGLEAVALDCLASPSLNSARASNIGRDARKCECG